MEEINFIGKSYEYLTKGLAGGVGIGIIIGAIAENILLFFALGGVLGIICATIFSTIKKFKIKHKA